MSPPTVRWGLLSTARVNGALLHAAAHTEAAEVVAVASRDAARAEEYARVTGIARAHGSYDALLADPEVDAVYVALPNALHAEWSRRALEAGKHVLCEKPFGRDPAAVAAAFDAAEAAGLVLMEGFMYRHRPQIRVLERLVGGGAIGSLTSVRASFRAPIDITGDVRASAALGGGALMDLGCYCVHAARLVLGEPEEVRAEGSSDGHEVDIAFAGTLAFAGGAHASVEAAFAGPPGHGLEVEGTTGSLRIADPWHGWNPGLELRRGDALERHATDEVDAHRLQLENMAGAVAGTEAPLLGRADAVGQARVLDALLLAAAGGRPVTLRPGEA